MEPSSSYAASQFGSAPSCGALLQLMDVYFTLNRAVELTLSCRSLLGQGADVLLGLTEKCVLSSSSSVTFDNFFTPFPLLDELSKQGVGGLGTIRQNRTENAAIPSKQAMKKTERGSYDCSTDNLGNVVVL